MNKKIIILVLIVLILVGFGSWYFSYRGGNIPPEVYIANPSPAPSNNANMPNPASVNCTKVGGTLVIQKRGDGGEYGLCSFGDNQACEEWALMRGECPVGGVKTTGFDNVDQKYCAWLGGQTLAVPDAKCTLPSGKVCLDTDLYGGKCS